MSLCDFGPGVVRLCEGASCGRGTRASCRHAAKHRGGGGAPVLDQGGCESSYTHPGGHSHASRTGPPLPGGATGASLLETASAVPTAGWKYLASLCQAWCRLRRDVVRLSYPRRTDVDVAPGRRAGGEGFSAYVVELTRSSPDAPPVVGHWAIHPAPPLKIYFVCWDGVPTLAATRLRPPELGSAHPSCPRPAVVESSCYIKIRLGRWP